MRPILKIAKKHTLFVVEDAAEAHGAMYHGRKVGSMGDVSTFSFYGNKIVTTGEGGMVTTNSDELAAKIRQTKGQGMNPDRRYWFTMVGYNYRMTNIEAAIGLAQLEKVAWHIQRRREVARLYQKYLNSVKAVTLQPEMPWASNVYWLTSLVLDDDAQISRDVLQEELAKAGIETRPFFYPIHTLPMYASMSNRLKFPVAESLARRGINLPSSALLSENEIIFIANQIASLLS
jgi:perosamine synthetase